MGASRCSRSSIIIVNVLFFGSGDSDDERLLSRARVAHICDGRLPAGGKGGSKAVSRSASGIMGNACVENVKRSRGVEVRGERRRREVLEIVH